MHNKLKKLLSFELWDAAVNTVRNYSEIYSDFLKWFNNKYIPGEQKNFPEDIKKYIKSQLDKALEDESKLRALINEYVWQNFRMASFFAEKYEKEMLDIINK